MHAALMRAEKERPTGSDAGAILGELLASSMGSGGGGGIGGGGVRPQRCITNRWVQALVCTARVAHALAVVAVQARAPVLVSLEL